MFEFYEPDFQLLATLAKGKTQFPLVINRLDLAFIIMEIEPVEKVVIGKMPVQPDILAPQTDTLQGMVKLHSGHHGAIFPALVEVRIVAGIIDRI